MKSKRRYKKRIRERLELLFRGLRGVKWRLTSRETKRYNCLAWAAEESHRRWEAGNGYWPNDVPRDLSLVALVRAYISSGFAVCPEAEGRIYHPEYDTIVLYEAFELYDRSRPQLGGENIGSHASKLLPNGWWSSKIGDWEDIQHPAPESLNGAQYGEPVIYMRRMRTNVRRRKPKE